MSWQSSGDPKIKRPKPESHGDDSRAVDQADREAGSDAGNEDLVSSAQLASETALSAGDSTTATNSHTEPATAEARPNFDGLAQAFAVKIDSRGSALMEPGRYVGSVRLETRLGAGGMGQVWAGVDEKLNRQVAVKALRSTLSAASKFRLRREARTLAKLDHPGICRIYDLLETPAADFLILERVHGLRLSESIRRNLEQPRALHLAARLADALAAAHALRIIHRDLKPDNVMVTAEDEIKVLDFGISRSATQAAIPSSEAIDLLPADADRLTATGLAIGTPRYMSPEQSRGEILTEASDLFSLGLVLQEMLTAKPAFVARDTSQLRQRIEKGEREPLPPDLDAELATLIEELTNLDPALRPDAEQARDRLRAVLDRPARRRRKLIAASLCLALAGSLGAALVSGIDSWRTRRLAEKQAVAAHRLGEEVQAVETLLRIGHLSPAHDINVERLMAEESLRRVERNGAALGEWAIGPTSYARGRMELALDRPERSRDELIKAWQNGYQRPEVATALGLAYGELYERAVDDAERQPSADLRRQARQRAIRELRNPAASWLRRGDHDDGGRQPWEDSMGKAYIALYEERFDQALEYLSDAAKGNPSLFEAHRLSARCWSEKAWSALRKGDNREAFDSFTAAFHALEVGGEIARSHAGLRAESCIAAAERASLANAVGASLEEIYDSATPLCHQAPRLDPSNPEMWLASAELAFGIGWQYLEDQKNPLPFLDRTEIAVTKALELQKKNAKAYLLLGNVATARGDWASITGQPSREFLQHAVELQTRTRELAPKTSSSHYSLGLALFNLSFTLLLEGEDPQAQLHSAVLSFEQAVAMAPNTYASHSMLGSSYGVMAMAGLAHGRNPQAHLTAAIEAFNEAIRLRPGSAVPRTNSAMAFRDLAKFRWLIGQPTDEACASGRRLLKEILSSQPDYLSAHTTLAEIEVIAAQDAVSRGLDPATPLANLADRITRIRKLASAGSDVYRLAARGHLADADTSMATRRSPLSALDAANVEAEAWMRTQSEPGAFEVKAEIELRRARWAAQQNLDPRPAVRQGLLLIEQAIKQRPGHAHTWLVRGQLERWLDPKRAEISFEKAVEINPWLERLVAEARSQPTLEKPGKT